MTFYGSPQDHVERAEALMKPLDNQFDEDGKGVRSEVDMTLYDADHIRFELARLHIELAKTKLSFNQGRQSP